MRIQRQRLERILSLRAEIDDNFGMGYPQQSQLSKTIQGHALLIFFPYFRNNVSRFESFESFVWCQLPAVFWNFLKAIYRYMINVLTNNCGLLP